MRARQVILKVLPILLFISINLFLYKNESDVLAAGNVYYVATTGNDGNLGSQSAPFKTFNKAVSVAQAGDTIQITPGTYFETLTIGTTKSDITVYGNNAVIDASNKNNGALLSGRNLVVQGIVVKNSVSHGILVKGQNVTVRDSEVYNSVLECLVEGAQCGSALKAERGSDGVLFENNYLHDNKLEGIAATMSRNVVIRNNRVSNNRSVEIYIDSSVNVRVENNFAYCNQLNSTGIALDNEGYSGWTDQLTNIYIGRNVVTGCKTGISYYGTSDIIDGAVIEYNTFDGIGYSVIYFATTPNKNVLIKNNLFQNIRPWFDDPSNLNGVMFDNNYWISSVPSKSTNIIQTNAKSGTPTWVTPHIWNDVNTFKQVIGSSACGYGRWECGETSPTATPVSTATPVVKMGDANGDNMVDDSDYNVWFSNYGQNVTGVTNGDFDNSGKVDGVDYVVWVINFGK